MSMIHSVFVLFGFFPVSAGALPALPAWMVGGLTIVSAVLALIGGVIAFKRSRMGSVFLILAALLCVAAPTEFWIYGSLYLIAAVFCFFLHRHSDFADDEYEEEDDEDDEDEDFDELDEERLIPREPHPRRRERASRIPAAPSGEKRVPLDHPSEAVPRVRRRTSKTCPTCGANVAIVDHYCPNCGSPLHTPADLSAGEPPSVPAEREPLSSSDVLRGPETPEPEDRGVFSVRSVPEPNADDLLPEEASEEAADGDLDPEGSAFEGPEPEKPMERALPFHEDIRVSTPYKVFVKPLKENENIPTRPLNIDPDASYQEFSQYARRRKRRTRSLGRRLAGVLLLLGLVGGTTWFLLGLRKLPENQLPVQPGPIVDPVVASSEIVASNEPVAQPVDVPSGALPSLTLRASPEQGRVTGSNVNLREDHSTGSRSIVRLQTNAKGTILDTWEGTSGTLSGLWYRIRTQDNKEGWIYGQYFLPIGEPLPKGYTSALLKSFGAGRAEAVAELGQPTQSKASSLGWRGLTLTLNGETITRIQLTGSGRELKNGVRVGMPRKDLVGIMGYPSHLVSGQWRYVESDGKGMGVQFNKDGAVSGVTVGSL